jgi:hypothetical protein
MANLGSEPNFAIHVGLPETATERNSAGHANLIDRLWQSDSV